MLLVPFGWHIPLSSLALSKKNVCPVPSSDNALYLLSFFLRFLTIFVRLSITVCHCRISMYSRFHAGCLLFLIFVFFLYYHPHCTYSDYCCTNSRKRETKKFHEKQKVRKCITVIFHKLQLVVDMWEVTCERGEKEGRKLCQSRRWVVLGGNFLRRKEIFHFDHCSRFGLFIQLT